MLTPDTADRIDLGLLRLRELQAAGAAPPPGQVSLRTLAAECGCSQDTIIQIERLAKAKLARGLLEIEADLPPRLARLLRSQLEDPAQPELF
ncbi:hypothetical protein [Luteolibacter marinus]|uniref:hypothetical protein n=1 Tax=Luteolibacter marinus TaxID=2776705 RepID=UPI001865C555|nr:hypothetical protein [Luteolibacter marinus]